MLIQPDRNELGDRRLDPAENLAKLKEDNRRLAGKRQLPGQELLTDVDSSVGRPLGYAEFLRRLRVAGADILVKDGMEGHVAVYVPKREWDSDYLERDPNRPADHWYQHYRYATGFPKGVLAEFSVVTTDEHGAPHREIRGWRSALMALVKAKGISYRAAVKEFGIPRGPREMFWHREMNNHKGAI